MIFGISSSSFQYEENNKNSSFYTKVNKDGNLHKKNWKKDFKLLQELGVQTYRFSVEWSDIEPTKGKYKDSAIQRYHEYIDLLQGMNIEPVVCLFHFSQPKWFLEEGGFLKNPDSFLSFAEKMIQEYKAKVPYFVIFNEPNVFAICSYILKRWKPNQQNYFHFSKVLSHMEDVANQLILSFPEVKFGVTLNIIPSYHDTFLNSMFDHMWNESFLPKISENLNFVGINYYFAKDKTWKDVFNSSKLDFFANSKTESDLGWPIDCEKLNDTIAHVQKYAPEAEIWITENGLSTEDDDAKCKFIESHVSQVLDNPVIKRYYYWTLIDCWEWDYGNRVHFGLVKTIGKSKRRQKRNSFYCYQKIIHESLKK